MENLRLREEGYLLLFPLTGDNRFETITSFVKLVIEEEVSFQVEANY